MYPVITTGTHGSEKHGHINVPQYRKVSHKELVTSLMPKVMCCAVCVWYVAESCLLPNSVSVLLLQMNILPSSCLRLLLIPACNLLCFYLLLFILLGQGFAALKLFPTLNFAALWPLSCVKLRVGRCWYTLWCTFNMCLSKADQMHAISFLELSAFWGIKFAVLKLPFSHGTRLELRIV